MPGLVFQAFNPSTWEAEAGVCLWIQGQPVLQSKFQDKDTLSWKDKKKKKSVIGFKSCKEKQASEKNLNSTETEWWMSK